MDYLLVPGRTCAQTTPSWWKQSAAALGSDLDRQQADDSMTREWCELLHICFWMNLSVYFVGSCCCIVLLVLHNCSCVLNPVIGVMCLPVHLFASLSTYLSLYIYYIILYHIISYYIILYNIYYIWYNIYYILYNIYSILYILYYILYINIIYIYIIYIKKYIQHVNLYKKTHTMQTHTHRQCVPWCDSGDRNSKASKVCRWNTLQMSWAGVWGRFAENSCDFWWFQE